MLLIFGKKNEQSIEQIFNKTVFPFPKIQQRKTLEILD